VHPSSHRSVVVVLGPPRAAVDACVSTLGALQDVTLLGPLPPDLAAAAVVRERTSLVVVAPGTPEAWVEEVLALTSTVSPPVPLLVLLEAGRAVAAGWMQGRIATLHVPSSTLALAHAVAHLLAGHSTPLHPP
jgi:hypothetical protein